jgi:hypothetical protein
MGVAIGILSGKYKGDLGDRITILLLAKVE